MRIVTGRICGLLNNEAGEINGFVLDNGRPVNVPVERASQVFAITSLGCRVEIEAAMRDVVSDGSHMDAVRITDLDSNRSVSLFAPTSSDAPEVSAGLCPPPGTAAPLAPVLKDFWGPNPRQAISGPLTTRNEVANEIEQAYDGLHRIQAMIAYLKMIKQEPSAIGEYLDEAKHTYMQALSRYQVRDLEGAREFAAASNSLSRVVEILISRTFHSNSYYPTLVPMPPEEIISHDDAGTAKKGLVLVDSLLARVRWITENGTLPSEDRAQIQRLSLWSTNLHRCAHRLIQVGAIGAIQFAQAAGAAACSAEHLCKKCYVTRRADSNAAIAAL